MEVTDKPPCSLANARFWLRCERCGYTRGPEVLPYRYALCDQIPVPSDDLASWRKLGGARKPAEQAGKC